MVGAIRHVGDQQGIPDAPAHRTGVVQHLVGGDRQRILIAQHSLGQGVADQHNVNTGLIYQACSGIVVRGQAGDGFVPKLLVA